ncbi:MAG: protein kinase domain-containing protein [Candidatus Saccharicenans sp.]|uniref:protein kinase domain-containing protein n=1 Tax=Candidatus Saccharicenans sp. TaxID=2819258 RepID=UPI004049256D
MTQNCPKCGTPNSDTRKFCGECGTPLSSSCDSELERTLTISAQETVWPGKGQLIAGKYQILRQAGKGGMGLVFEAQDVRLKRSVALKFLPAELLGEERARERFIHEAQAASALDHPNICNIYEIGETEEQQTFIAMAFYKGESLKHRIRRGPLSPDETLSLALQIAEGLAAAHDHGIVHRDVKPANIIITEEGQVKLVDFGLAKLAGEAHLTQPGTVLGTIAYMSPEQLMGGESDARTDVWSLGVVIYEMLTGCLPFEGDTEPACAYSIVHNKLRPIKSLPLEIPRDLAAIVERALAKDPEDRFASAREMAEALKALAEGRRFHPGVRKKFSRRAAVLGMVIVLVATVLIIPSWRYSLKKYVGLGETAKKKHLVLLPLKAISGAETEQLLAEGLSDLLHRQLGQLIFLGNRSWVSPLRYIESYEVREAADARRLLGADIVLTGTLRLAGEMLTVSIDIIDARSLRRLNSLSLTDNLANISTWQENMALETAGAAGFQIQAGARAVLARGATTMPAAFKTYLLGLGYFSREGLDNARLSTEVLEETVKIDPSFSEALVDLGRAYWRLFCLNEDAPLVSKAESYLQEALRLGGANDLAHLSLSRIYFGLGRYEEAVGAAKAVNRNSAWFFDALVNLAQIQSLQKRPDLAEATYLEASGLRPGYWVALSYLGLFYFYQGRLEKARDIYQEVVRVTPDNINGLNNLGGTYFKLGDDLRAEQMFERSNAIKRNPDAFSNLGFLYYYRGRYADAVAMSESALTYEKNDPVLWGNLADAAYFVPGYEEKSRQAYDRAIELAEKMLTFDKGNAGLRSSLAVYQVKRQNAARALVEISESLKIQPDDPTVVLKSVIVYELSGDREKALRALQKYVALKGPKEEVLREPFLASLRRAPEFNEIMTRDK